MIIGLVIPIISLLFCGKKDRRLNKLQMEFLAFLQGAAGSQGLMMKLSQTKAREGVL